MERRRGGQGAGCGAPAQVRALSLPTDYLIYYDFYLLQVDLWLLNYA